MKCEHCGAPIGLEDKFCAYCGAPNTQALQHQADMDHYEREFQKTQAEVMKSTGRMARISSRLIVLAVLVVMNIGAFIFAGMAGDLAWDAREKELEKHASDFRADMDALIENKEYLKLYDYYSSNHLSSVDSLQDYSTLSWAAYRLESIHEILCGDKNLGGGYLYSDGSGLREYDVESLAEAVAQLYEAENDYYGYKLTDQDKKVLEEMREYAAALFIGYTSLTEEQVRELPNLSKSKAMEMIREGVKMYES